MTDLPRQLANRLLGGLNSRYSRGLNGGEGGIRTLGTLAGTRDFQSRTFDHSATSPEDGREPSAGSQGVNPSAAPQGRSTEKPFPNNRRPSPPRKATPDQNGT